MTLCVQLSHFGVIKFSGTDAEKYLQGQVTADISQLTANHSLATAKSVQYSCQCDTKGKTLSTFYIMKYQDSYLLLGQWESLKLSLAAFQKFAVFSQVTIEDISDSVKLYGLDTRAVEQFIESSNANLPIPEVQLECSLFKSTIIFRVQGKTPRFVVVQLSVDTDLDNATPPLAWKIADIQSGLAHLCSKASGQFVPQMLNLQALDAISFTKGCYMGQETVARAKYLGKNKRAGYILTGTSDSAPDASDVIEMQIGENWRRGGAIADLAWDSDTKQVWIYSVLPNDIASDAVLRIKSQPITQLSIQPLPYNVE